MYEIGKYLTNKIIVQLQAEDDVDAPDDYARASDQSDLNRLIQERQTKNFGFTHGYPGFTKCSLYKGDK